MLYSFTRIISLMALPALCWCHVSCSSEVSSQDENNLQTEEPQEEPEENTDPEDKNAPVPGTLKSKLVVDKLTKLAVGKAKATSLHLVNNSREGVFGIDAEGEIQEISLVHEDPEKGDTSNQSSVVAPPDPDPYRAADRILFDAKKAVVIVSWEWEPPEHIKVGERKHYCNLLVIYKKDGSVHCIPNIYVNDADVSSSSDLLYTSSEGDSVVFMGSRKIIPDFQDSPVEADVNGIYKIEFADDAPKLLTIYEDLDGGTPFSATSNAAGEPVFVVGTGSDALLQTFTNNNKKVEIGNHRAECLVGGKDKTGNYVYFLEPASGSDKSLVRLEFDGDTVTANTMMTEDSTISDSDAIFRDFSCRGSLSGHDGHFYFIGRRSDDRVVIIRMPEEKPNNPKRIVLDGSYQFQKGRFLGAAIDSSVYFLVGSSSSSQRLVNMKWIGKNDPSSSVTFNDVWSPGDFKILSFYTYDDFVRVVGFRPGDRKFSITDLNGDSQKTESRIALEYATSIVDLK